jgi:hypothetical protein
MYGSGRLLGSGEGRISFFRLRALIMKLIRITLLFAAGVYFGLNIEKFGNLESLALALQSLAQKIQELRR